MPPRQKAEAQWHARAPFWIGLALTAVGGFATVKAQLAVVEARQADIPSALYREVDSLERRLAAVESRCK